MLRLALRSKSSEIRAPYAEPGRALPEGDPAVSGGAVVVDHHLRVGDPLAAVPADLAQPLGDRSGGDDVAGDDHERAPELGQVRRPGIHRHDQLLGREQPAAVGADRQWPLPGEAGHARVLEDPHPELERDAPQPPGQRGRLHGRGPALEHAGQVGGRPRPARHLGRPQPLERVDPEALGERHHRVPRAGLGRSRRGPQQAAAAEVAVDLVGLAEAPQLVDRGLRGAPEPDRLLVATEPDQAGEFRPPAQHHAAVAARGAAAADVLLEHDHIAGAVGLLDPDRAPQPHEAAAGDRHVRPRRALQWWQRRAVGQDLAQPQRPVPAVSFWLALGRRGCRHASCTLMCAHGTR